MKKYVIIPGKVLAALIFSTTIYAQNNTATASKYKMGVIVGTGLNIGKVDNTSAMQNYGVGTNLSIGMVVQKSINQNLSFNTGIEFDFDRFNYNSNENEILYYKYSEKDLKIFSKEELKEQNNNNDVSNFTLEDRNINTTYLTIPTLLTGKTNLIGKNSYFARIGLRHSFLLKQEFNDNGKKNDSNETTALEDLSSPNELRLYKVNLGISIGTEWNVFDNSFLVFELGYFAGLTNIHQAESILGDDKQKDMSLFNDKTTPKYTTVKGTQNQLLLKATFLF
jgi:hypothetical protein